MRYLFYVFHNYEAIAGHTDFIHKRAMNEARETVEYALIAELLVKELERLDMAVQTANRTLSRGLSVGVTTDASLFKVQLALSKILVDRNAAVEGLFLDFVQL